MYRNGTWRKQIGTGLFILTLGLWSVLAGPIGCGGGNSESSDAPLISIPSPSASRVSASFDVIDSDSDDIPDTEYAVVMLDEGTQLQLENPATGETATVAINPDGTAGPVRVVANRGDAIELRLLDENDTLGDALSLSVPDDRVSSAQFVPADFCVNSESGTFLAIGNDASTNAATVKTFALSDLEPDSAPVALVDESDTALTNGNRMACIDGTSLIVATFADSASVRVFDASTGATLDSLTLSSGFADDVNADGNDVCVSTVGGSGGAVPVTCFSVAANTGAISGEVSVSLSMPSSASSSAVFSDSFLAKDEGGRILHLLAAIEDGGSESVALYFIDTQRNVASRAITPNGISAFPQNGFGSLTASSTSNRRFIHITRPDAVEGEGALSRFLANLTDLVSGLGSDSPEISLESPFSNTDIDVGTEALSTLQGESGGTCGATSALFLGHSENRAMSVFRFDETDALADLAGLTDLNADMTSGLNVLRLRSVCDSTSGAILTLGLSDESRDITVITTDPSDLSE